MRHLPLKCSLLNRRLLAAHCIVLFASLALSSSCRYMERARSRPNAAPYRMPEGRRRSSDPVKPVTEFASFKTGGGFTLAGTRKKLLPRDRESPNNAENYLKDNREAQRIAAAHAEQRTENNSWRFERQGFVIFPDGLKLNGYWLPSTKQHSYRSPGGVLGKIYSTYRGLPSRPRLCVWPGESREDPAKISRCVMISQKADEFYIGEIANGYFHGQGTLYFTRGVLGPLSELFIFQGEFRYGWPFAGRIFCKRPAREVCEVFAAIFHGPISVELVDSFGLFQDESALLLPELQDATEFLKTL